MIDTRKREFLLPVRILLSEGMEGAENLLKNNPEQIYFWHENFAYAKKGSRILLDFGRELHGGIRILTREGSYRNAESSVRIRFGESVGEALSELDENNATNHHSSRDMTVHIPPLSDLEFGQTGFRFVCIDFLSEEPFSLAAIYAVYVHRGLERIGSFVCNDELVNRIYQTACDTVYLNMQNRLWDGIKRDRLVWIGDMHPEVKSILYAFGDDICIRQALDESARHNPLPAWMSTIPTYSMWWIRILCDYWKFTAKDEFFLAQLSYLEGVLNQFDRCIFEDGSIDYWKDSPVNATHGYFLDWESSESPENVAGNAYLYQWCLTECVKTIELLGIGHSERKPELDRLCALCRRLMEKLSKKKYLPEEKKQVLAFGYLSKQLEAEYVAPKLVRGGAEGYSTFMSSYILRATAESAGCAYALDAMREFYGGMLSRGATSFWESFDVSWLRGSGRIDEMPRPDEKDIHSSFGKYCYKGYRLSLCHGWASGPVSFLNEQIFGIKIEEPGCRKIVLSPDLGNLTFAEGSLPTPYGTVKVTCSKTQNGIRTEYDAPKEVNVKISK